MSSSYILDSKSLRVLLDRSLLRYAIAETLSYLYT